MRRPCRLECPPHPAENLAHPARPCLQVIGRSRKQKVEVDRASVTEAMQVDGKKLQYKQMEGAFSQPNGGEPSSPWQHLICQKSVLLHLVSNTAVREPTQDGRGGCLAIQAMIGGATGAFQGRWDWLCSTPLTTRLCCPDLVF